MPSTFETLSDEILMIILEYAGNVYNIFRTFSGLNQRLNKILLDRRLHLFTNFLYIHHDDTNIDYYYNSTLFHDICKQLSSMTITKSDEALRQCFQSLAVSFIKEQSNRLKHEFQSNMESFQSIRGHLTNDEMRNIDKELNKSFNNLQKCSISIKNIELITSLVLTKGARLECDDRKSCEFNLAKAINQLLLAKLNIAQYSSQLLIDSFIQMFKTLIISNPSLLKNQDYFYSDGFCIHFFLCYSINLTNDIFSNRTLISINMQYYQAVLDLLLFIIQCLKHIFNQEVWAKKCLLDILNTIIPRDIIRNNEIFIYASLIGLFDIILNDYSLEDKILLDKDFGDTFRRILDNLIENNQLLTLLSIYHTNERIRNFFQNSWNNQKYVNIMTTNRTARQFFHALLDDHLLRTWLTSTDLLFVLLKKKECKIVKKLLKLSPSLVHQFDENGNDPLLYVCLKVRGCRECLVEFLIEKGCDLQRRNLKGENLIDVLQLERNRQLLERLIERKVIQIDNVSGEIKVTLVK
ncbi:unnamed protein product [Rotaria sp. Silwood2]|nr:unnamed protein product [Rotaria sp. Silwood2]CAF4243907.1 unnamed protein product [Rotaria sp. Silwood2]